MKKPSRKPNAGVTKAKAKGKATAKGKGPARPAAAMRPAAFLAASKQEPPSARKQET